MVLPLRPRRGGFLRPFGPCWFILEFLSGRAPYGAPTINPARGAPQSDIRFQYKEALHRAYAEDLVAGEEGKRVREKKPPLTLEEAEALRRYFLARTPMKMTRMRYHSFLVYFRLLKKLGWVEPTGETEPSEFQERYPPGPPRIYYRITAAGLAAPPTEVSNPLYALYPHFDPAYFASKRRERRRKYLRR